MGKQIVIAFLVAVGALVVSLLISTGSQVDRFSSDASDSDTQSLSLVQLHAEMLHGRASAGAAAENKWGVNQITGFPALSESSSLLWSRSMDGSLGRKGASDDVKRPWLMDMAEDASLSPVFVERRPVNQSENGSAREINLRLVPNGSAQESRGSFIGCFPLKNGNSWWKRFACEADSRCDANDDTASDGAPLVYLSGLPRFYSLSAAEQKAALADTSIPRFMIKRNPVIRALSAFLTWVENGNTWNYVPTTFDAFVRKLDASRTAHWSTETFIWSKNGHWRPQTDYCHLEYGEKYEQFKAEDRAKWGPHFLSKLCDDCEELAARLNFSRADQPNDDGCHAGYGCHAKATMARYYTPELYEIVRRYYWRDIVFLEYEADVDALKEELFATPVAGRRRRAKHSTSTQLMSVYTNLSMSAQMEMMSLDSFEGLADWE